MDSKRLAINALHLQDGEADDTRAKDAPEPPATPALPAAAPEGPTGAAPAHVATSAVPIRDEEGARDQEVAELMGIPPRLVPLARLCFLVMLREARKRQRRSRSSTGHSRSSLRPGFRRPNGWFPGPPPRTFARRTRPTWRSNNSKG
jgi:hypothetical protein